MGVTDLNIECPKLEDFLGGCYTAPSSSSPSSNLEVNQVAQINVNIPPTFDTTSNEGEAAFSYYYYTPQINQTLMMLSSQFEGTNGNLHNLQGLALTMNNGPNIISVAHEKQEMVVVEETNKKRCVFTSNVASSSSDKEITPRKPIDTFGQGTSQYRGVTRHRWTHGQEDMKLIYGIIVA